MNISSPFILRPVMTTLLMAAFLLAGVFGYRALPISKLPEMEFPTVSVTARLPGANAETMATSVATPIEKEISRIAGVDSMTSESTQGISRITVQFKFDRSIDAAAQDVQAAIAAVANQMPRDMPSTPTVRKVNPTDQSILMFVLSSPTLSLSQVNTYAETTVVRRLSTLEGVAQIDIFGEAKPAVRIQADPDALAARGIGIDEVANAVRAANVNQATGQLDGRTRAAIIQTEGQLNSADQFRKQIVAYRDGKPVRFEDIATVLDDVENNKLYNNFNGAPNLMVAIRKQPGANTVEVVDNVLAAFPSIREQLPPSIHMETFFDRSTEIRESIVDVQLTMVFSALLVVGVIFLFLRTVSATFIPSIAMPIALVGAFAFMALFGFSIDTLSLMALTLSVIFIVDDAIVMLENIMRHVEAGERPFDAAVKGSKEVSFTILSMTLSLAAVFIPVLFMGGIVGRLLFEFAVTIVVAILVSGFISVTLTPMLCSRIIKPAAQERASSRHGAIYRVTENVFNAGLEAYRQSLHWSLRNHRFIFGLFAASLVVSFFLFRTIPQDFLPAEDTGLIEASTAAATGTSFMDMKRRQEMAARIALEDPNVDSVLSSIGGFGSRGTNSGSMNIRLKPRSERDLDIDEVMAQLRRKFATIPGLEVFLRNPPSIRIGAVNGRSQYQYTLQAADTEILYPTAMRLTDALKAAPDFVDVSLDLDFSAPTVNVAIARDRAAALGVSVEQIEGALGSAFGGRQVSTIYTSVDQYQVILELKPEFQQEAAALSRLYLTGAGGSLVPLSAVTTITHGAMAPAETHVGLLPAVALSFGLRPGVPLSTAVQQIEQIETDIGVPASVQTSFQGTAQAFQQSMQGMGFLLLAGIVVVYIVLGILYESFIHPLTILAGLPAAAVGALATLWAFGVPLTLYAFVGLIMLIGIVKKNAIMMIDFALARQREHGADPESAIVEAALVRFRPIMMTTAAALVGALPIALGLGAGGEGRQPLGLAVVGGLMVSQALTLYITPVIYLYLEHFGHRVMRPRRQAVPLPGE